MHIHRLILQFHKAYKPIVTIIRSKCNEHIIKSKSPSIVIPNQLIHEYVWQNLNKWHSKTAVICFETERSYTFEQVYYKSRALAKVLRQKFSLNVGDTVAVILPNVIDFPIAFLGSIQAGLVVTTVNPFYTAEEISNQLEDSGSKLIFTVRDILAVVNTATATMKRTISTIVTDANSDSLPNNCVKLHELCDSYEGGLSEHRCYDDIALLPYSSGTTGLSKGVQLTHKNVVSNLYQMSSPDFIVNRQTEENFQDVVPVFLPLFHIYGMVGIFLNFFAQGCKLIMVPNFVGPQFTKLLYLYHPTLLFAVPPIIAILNNPKIKFEDLKSVRKIISAAAPLGVTSVEKFRRKTQGKISLLQMYGMTETSPLTHMQTPKLQNGTKIGGSGFLIPNTEAKIIPLNGDHKKTLGANKTGELVVRGPQVMKGYHNNTSEALLENNWLKTGDICHYDEDEHFFITGRLKELIKVKGFQVAPAELEEILRSHSLIEDAAVVGIPHSVQGEAPKAFIVLKSGANIKGQQVKEFVASKVAGYKRLVGGVVVIDKIPRNLAGKILRNQLRKM